MNSDKNDSLQDMIDKNLDEYHQSNDRCNPLLVIMPVLTIVTVATIALIHLLMSIL